MEKENKDQFLNPYISGILIGTTISAFYLIFGCGFSVGEAFERFTAFCCSRCLPENFVEFKFMKFFEPNPIMGYCVFLTFGLGVGGFLSALINRRVELKLERGKKCRKVSRIVLSCLGGFLTAFGLIYSRGGVLDIAFNNFVTQATGGFIFLMSFVIFGYVFSFLFWGQWHD